VQGSIDQPPNRGSADDLHLGGDASQAVVKRTALDDYPVVYFATHGI
jgi:hypothetical protein